MKINKNRKSLTIKYKTSFKIPITKYSYNHLCHLTDNFDKKHECGFVYVYVAIHVFQQLLEDYSLQSKRKKEM